MIIGLTGKNGAGKGLVAEYLQSKHFAYHSLSDVIREEIRKEGVDVTRERLIAKGRELRQKRGASVLADLILAKIDPKQNAIVDSIRNPAEVQALRSSPAFLLIAVDAEQKIRFERCQKRGRENDPKTLDEFIRLENAELQSEDPAAQQLIKTFALADFVVKNETIPEDCYRQVDMILQQKKAGA